MINNIDKKIFNLIEFIDNYLSISRYSDRKNIFNIIIEKDSLQLSKHTKYYDIHFIGTSNRYRSIKMSDNYSTGLKLWLDKNEYSTYIHLDKENYQDLYNGLLNLQRQIKLNQILIYG